MSKPTSGLNTAIFYLLVFLIIKLTKDAFKRDLFIVLGILTLLAEKILQLNEFSLEVLELNRIWFLIFLALGVCLQLETNLIHVYFIPDLIEQY